MIDLSTLVAPTPPGDFLREHWPDKPFWLNGSADRAAALREIPELESPEAALMGARTVKVFRPDGEMSVVPDGKSALPLFRLGLTCYLGSRHIPALRESAESLASDLGLPSGAIDCEVFCSSGDSGAWMHSDYDVNFALLLHGRKHWRLAPNEHIRNQTNMCVPATREAPDPLQLELADRQPFPERMPEDALEVDVEAGGLVFMPRGWWHETKAAGDCLQVNFVVQGPMWLKIVSRAVSEALMRDPDMRAFTYGLFGSPAEREAALRRLAEMLPMVRERLDELVALDDPRRAAEELVRLSGFKAARDS